MGVVYLYDSNGNKIIDSGGNYIITDIIPAAYTIELRDKNFSLIKILTKVARDLSWDYDRIGGCGRCSLTLSLESLENISADYDIQIRVEDVSGNSQLVYRGYLESYRPVMDLKDSIQIDAFGYVGQLDRVRVNYTYTTSEISVIVKDILDTYVKPSTRIDYNAADIEATNFTVDEIVFDCLASEALKTLADLAGLTEWGVDRNLKFFFKKQSDSINFYLRKGINIKKFDNLDDYSTIINRINIKGSDLLDETVNNLESQSAYGLRTQIVSQSSMTTSAVAQQYGASILAEKARINRKTTIQVINNTQFFEGVTPLGKVSILSSNIPQAKEYGDNDAIYWNFKYGGLPSYQINKITYKIAGSATSVNMNAGYARPDIADEIKRIEFQLNQLRNKT